MKKYFILLMLFIYSFSSFAQNKVENYIKTSEYDKYGNKRRDIYLDSSMQIIKEEYYAKDNHQVIFKIEYSAINKLKNIVALRDNKKLYEIDYLNGTYEDYENDLTLKFIGNYIFNGKQRGKNIIVNYQNGVKEGRIIQADSAVISNKVVAYQKVDPKYLQFNIVKFYNSIELDPVFTIYNGLILSFNQGKLNGDQSSFYVDGKIKFKANFFKDKLIKYTSFDKSNSIISKIETDSGVSNKIQILNGQILSNDEHYIFWLNSLIETGDIVNAGILYDQDIIDEIRRIGRENERLSIGEVYYDDNEKRLGGLKLSGFLIDNYVQTNNQVLDIFNLKKKFDNFKHTFNDAETMRMLLGIPRFSIKQFSYQMNEDALIKKIKINSNNLLAKKIINDTIALKNGYYFLKSPFPCYEYRRNMPNEFLILPHDDLNGVKNISYEDYDEIRLQNEKLAKWIKGTFGVNPSNLYFAHKESGANNYYINTDTTYLKNFLNDMISIVEVKIKEFESTGSLEQKYTYRFNDAKDERTSYYMQSIELTEKYISLINKNDGTEIKIYYDWDRYKSKTDFIIEIFKNSKKYILLMNRDEN